MLAYVVGWVTGCLTACIALTNFLSLFSTLHSILQSLISVSLFLFSSLLLSISSSLPFSYLQCLALVPRYLRGFLSGCLSGRLSSSLTYVLPWSRLSSLLILLLFLGIWLAAWVAGWQCFSSCMLVARALSPIIYSWYGIYAYHLSFVFRFAFFLLPSFRSVLCVPFLSSALHLCLFPPSPLSHSCLPSGLCGLARNVSVWLIDWVDGCAVGCRSGLVLGCSISSWFVLSAFMFSLVSSVSFYIDPSSCLPSFRLFLMSLSHWAALYFVDGWLAAWLAFIFVLVCPLSPLSSSFFILSLGV